MSRAVLLIDTLILSAQQVEQQAVVLRERLRGERGGVLRQVRRAGYGDTVGDADLPRNQAAVAQLADAQGYVQTFADQVLKLIAELQVDLHVRVVLQETAQPRGDMQAAKAHRRADAKRAGDGFSAGLEAVFRR